MLDGFIVVLELHGVLLMAVWESPLRVGKTQDIKVTVFHRKEDFLFLGKQPLHKIENFDGVTDLQGSLLLLSTLYTLCPFADHSKGVTLSNSNRAMLLHFRCSNGSPVAARGVLLIQPGCT